MRGFGGPHFSVPKWLGRREKEHRNLAQSNEEAWEGIWDRKVADNHSRPLGGRVPGRGVGGMDKSIPEGGWRLRKEKAL